MRAQDAKELPIWAILERLGHIPLKEVGGEKWYCSPFREEVEPSFKLSRDGRAWYDHGAGQGGNIIDLMLVLEPGSDVRDVLRRLDTLMGSSISAMHAQPSFFPDTSETAHKKSATVPDKTRNALSPNAADGDSEVAIQRVHPLQHPALKQYLREDRKIDPHLAAHYVTEIHYQRHGKGYFALGFGNQAGGYELRNAFFKGGIGKKAITLLHPDKLANSVAVFEGFMDFLARLAVTGQSEPQMPVIVLNGTGQVQQAIAALMEHKPQIVECYLDNDAAGKQLVTTLKDALEPEGITLVDRSGLYRDYKDFNAYWVARVRAEEQSRVM